MSNQKWDVSDAPDDAGLMTGTITIAEMKCHFANDMQLLHPQAFICSPPEDVMADPLPKINFIDFRQRVELVTTPSENLVHTIIDYIFQQSLSYYQNNQFARLLRQHFEFNIVEQLLKRFQIGTLNQWLGACTFWYIDEYKHKRSGQIRLFDDTIHTANYIDHTGEKKSRTSWVHAALIRCCQSKHILVPHCLPDYDLKLSVLHVYLAYLKC